MALLVLNVHEDIVREYKKLFDLIDEDKNPMNYNII